MVGSAALAAQGSHSPQFSATIAPFLQQHCIKCHGPDKQEGDLRLDKLDSDLVKGRDAQIWNDVRAKLLAGEMPPEKQPRPPVQELQRAVYWLTDGLKANGNITLRQPPDFNHPRFGNRVGHEALFRPPVGAVSASPGRAWRLSSFGYEGLASGLFKSSNGRGNGGLPQPFGAGGGPYFLDYSSLSRIDEPTISQLLSNAMEIVEFQTTPNRRKGRPTGNQPPKQLIALVEGAGLPGAAEMAAGITLQFQLVLQRDPSAEELREFVDLMAKNIKTAGRETGVRSALAAVLMLPEALYRTEFGGGPPDTYGRLRLTPREIAVALSYAFTDKRPDATLRAAEEQGRLKTSAGVRQEVVRLLNDASYEKPRILRFFQEYFGYTAATDVFKNESDFREHGPVVLVDDTDHLVEYVLARDKNVFYELLTTNKSFVGYIQKPGVKRNHADSVRLKGNAYLSYSLDERPDDAQQPVELPAGQRMGILTQPSWLVAFSENTENSAILRGKWIRERLFGGTIPDLPITVAAMLPDEPHRTLRDRMTVTQNAACWKCHERMNPLGLPFEMYDHFGRYRTTESVTDPIAPPVRIKNKKTAEAARKEMPLDASGLVAGSGDPKLEGKVNNAVEMIRKLAASPQVRQVFIRHAFRYWMGRNETLDDGPTLAAADRDYVASGGSMKALIASLLTSDSFLLRRPQPSKTAMP